eukprot:jgi/Botrbrau1/9593/Bobra.106_2s0016.2
MTFPSRFLSAGFFVSCAICPESFKDVASLYEHTLSHHNFPQAKPLKCALCRKRVPDYLQHLRVHVKEQHAAGPSCASPVALDWGEIHLSRGPFQEEVFPAHAPRPVEAVDVLGASIGGMEEPKPGRGNGEADGTQSFRTVVQTTAAEEASSGASVTEPTVTSSSEEKMSPQTGPRPPMESDSDALRERFVQQLLIDAFCLDR